MTSRRLLLTGTPKSSLKRSSSSASDSFWLDVTLAASHSSSSILSNLREVMDSRAGGNLSRTLQDEAKSLRPLLALLD